jgi:hypothetical protein
MVVVDGLGFTMMGEKVGEDCKLKNKKQVLDGLPPFCFLCTSNDPFEMSSISGVLDTLSDIVFVVNMMMMLMNEIK